MTAESTSIVGSFAPRSEGEALAAAPAAAALPGVSMVEIRLDGLSAAPDFAALRAAFAGKTLLATVRSTAEGGLGMLQGVEGRERPLLSAALEAGFDLVDVEFRGGGNADLMGLPPGRVVVSVHDTAGVPAGLEGLLATLLATGARFVKAAATARDAADALGLLALQRSNADGRLVVFGMGEPGLATRVLSPYLGAPLSFGALLPGRATAPGQVAAAELADVYGVGRKRSVERLYALFGGVVSHSYSPAIHNANFEAFGLESLYVPFAVRSLEEEIRPLVTGLSLLGLPLAGASVTIPFKEQAARLAGLPEGLAVNTLLASSTGEAFEAANTDRLALEAALPQAGRGDRALILGAGGMARAAAGALKGKDYDVFVWNRHLPRARELARAAGIAVLPRLTEAEGPFRVLVNATPLGLAAGDPLPCPEGLLRPGVLVLDAPYRLEGTPLVRAAREAGATIVDGFALLLLQAAGQAELFTGQRTTARDLHDRLPARMRSLFASAVEELA